MTDDQIKTKKPFNKAEWRAKKYGHGHKVDQWRDKHKMSMARSYHKMLKKEEKKALHLKGGTSKNPNLEPIGDKRSFGTDMKAHTSKSGFSRAKNKFEEKIAQREKKKEEFIQRQKEKEEAIKKYKEKKAMKMKVLKAKTKRGQPVMAGRMELLLAQIEKSCNENN